MTKSRTYHSISFGVLSGNTLILFGIIAFLSFMFFSSKSRIHEIHRELFNASGPLSYDVDFGNFCVVAHTRITSVPRQDSSKWKDLPFMSQAQTYRVTHKIGFGSHTGTIELKVGDNGQEAEFLSSDILVKFEASQNAVNFNIAPFRYEAPDFRLAFGDLSGTFSQSGHIKVNINALELKMVNYIFKFAEMSLEVPQDKKSISLLASQIILDDVNLSHSKVVFGGSDPFEIKLNSSFKSQPVEVHWSIQKATILDQNVKVGSGKMKFPVTLLDAYVEPKIERSLLAEEKQAKVSSSEKVRFLYSAAREVRKAEAKAVALRIIALSKNIQRDGEFYQIIIDKQDAYKNVEEHTQKSVERQGYIASWSALAPAKMFEEAFYGVVFGDENRALAVKELLELKKAEHADNSIYLAVKARSAMRDALINIDEYNPVHLAKAAELVPAVISRIPDHKFAILLKLELAKAKGDKALSYQLYEEFRNKEQEPQIRAMFEFMKYIHVDNPKALESLENANAINPKSLYVQNLVRNRIHVYQHMGEKEKMEEDFRILLGNKSLAPEDLLAYSNLLEEKKDFETALKVVEKCIELNSVHKDCHDQRESVMTLIAYEKQKEKPDEAVQYLHTLLVDRPASVPANAGLGLLYKLRNDQDNSVKHYSIACALGGSFACIEAGDYLSRQNAAQKATLLYDVSCDLRSGNGCMKAGLHAEKIGELERSGIYYDRACNELHDNVACYHLARSLQKKRAPNRSIVPYLSKACKLYDSACKLAVVYQNTNKQPDIPLEPK